MLAQREVLEGELAVTAAEEGEQSQEVEQGGDHRPKILVDSGSKDQHLAAAGVLTRDREQMGDVDQGYLSVHDLASRIRRREVSPVEVVEAHLRRIEALNPRLSAFFTLTADRALEEARRAEGEIAAGHWRGPLHGVPYGAKDIVETAGVRTTHGSSFFRDHVPAQDAECIVRLRRAGAILIGKTLTHEFASAATTINPYYGTARNPWKLDRITGGSSGSAQATIRRPSCSSSSAPSYFWP